MIFSASTRGFYGSSAQSTPSDAVPISSEDYVRLLEGQAQGFEISSNERGFPTLIAPASYAPTADGLCIIIDAAADTARVRVVGEPLRAVEYARAAAEAAEFKGNGYPIENVPRCVAAWAISGRTAKEAADSILAEAAAFTEALYKIREIRLGAKEGVRQALAGNDTMKAKDITSEAVSTIQLAVYGVGNTKQK
ncbi:hypothetical protein [Pseudomonas saudiphocaensis]|uniref:Putative tail fiber assembly-like protein n=1 Tax=Pseudomonas saudiphocaensis TaxID=1499686 RepID=A0A078LUM4_9PSED|nr:hypothetical protein [Pseudomonas saudiphocaensis]CDZ93576.1 putative tail fiber assembly-like protein [Pseudomonas saudiphocaensis]